MNEIQVGPTPLDLGAVLNLGTGGSVSFFRIQNRGAGTVYRTVAATSPDPSAVRGFRHPVGSILPVRIVADPAERTWIWNASGTGTVVIEDGNY